MAMAGLAALVCVAGCNSAQDYAPPDLGDSDEALVIDDDPMQRGEQRSGSYAGDGIYLGFVFQAMAGETYDISLTRVTGTAVPAIAIYQHGAEGFGEPLAWASADAGSITLGGWNAPGAGTYLLLVDVASGPRDGTFLVTIACTEGCGDPLDCATDADCAAGQVCYGGLCFDDGVECGANQDCRAGEVCERGFCVEVCTPTVETCDGVDNDCDGLVDEDCGDPCTSDADCATGEVCMNGLCVPDSTRCSANVDCPAGQVCVAGQCVVDSLPCATDADCPAGEFCDAATGTCQVACLCATDADCPTGSVCRDCACWPVCEPAVETCDGVDNDCDGLIDEDCGNPCTSDADCAAGEVCLDGVCVADSLPCRTDADCPAGQFCDAATGTCVADTCQVDLDGDGFTCSVDCDDADAAVYPGALEACDGLDNDCDGQVDEGCGTGCSADADCPAGLVCLAGVCTDPGTLCSTDADCAAGEICWSGVCILACRTDAECAAGEVCVGGVCTAACVPGQELCDGLDNDCDGLVDEDCGMTCASDADCPAGMVCMSGLCTATCTDQDGDGFCADEDCDDADASVNPAAAEFCDGLDNDCDGQVDEGCAATCGADADCAAGEMCLDGVCVVNSCRTDAECPAGLVCVANVCQLP